jgi:hypothetical protein
MMFASALVLSALLAICAWLAEQGLKARRYYDLLGRIPSPNQGAGEPSPAQGAFAV